MRLPAADTRATILSLAAIAAGVGIFFVPQLSGGAVQWDAVEVHYSAQRYLSDALHAGQLPFWTPYIFSGFPFLADLQTGAWYPLNWPFLLLGITPASISHELLLAALIACTGAYVLALRLLGGRHVAALGTALFYGFSGFFAGHMQHVGMVQTAAWLPWLLLLLDLVRARLSMARVALAGLLGAAIALPGNFQIALYAVVGAAVWALLEALARRSPGQALRSSATLGALGVWGAALAAVMIGPGLELVRQSVRTRLDATTVELGFFDPQALWTLVQPDHFGVMLGSRYTGPGDVTQHYFYAGVLLVPLAVIGAIRQPRVLRAALFLAVPFVWYATGPAGGLFNLVALLPGFHSVELPMHGWFLPALALALLAGAGLPPRAFGALLLLLALVDVVTFNVLQNRLAFSRQSFEEVYQAPQQAFASRLTEPLGRVYGPTLMGIGYRNDPLQSRIESTYGYNPLELAGYADYQDAAERNPRLVDGLAATHRLEYREAGLVAEPNPTALPLVSIAPRVRVAPYDEAPLEDLDPHTETLVATETPALEAVRADPTASVSVTGRGDDWLALRYRAAEPSLLRVAVPFYPGWHATLNGAELPVLTIDRALTGVVVPPGEGDIRLAYTPRFFLPSVLVSGVALLATAAALVWAWLKRGRTACAPCGPDAR